MTGKRIWKNRPALWATAFGVFDVLWLFLIHIVAWATSNKLSDNFIRDQMITVWNAAHKPIRTIIEPIFFPVVTFHPPVPSDAVFLVYEAMCILQFVIIGYVVGVAVLYGMKK